MPTIASDPTSASDPAQREKLKKWMETVLPIPDGTKVEAGMVVIPADCADPFAAFMGALGTPLVIPMDFADGPDRTSKVTVCTACRGVDGCLPGCTRSGAGETT